MLLGDGKNENRVAALAVWGLLSTVVLRPGVLALPCAFIYYIHFIERTSTNVLLGLVSVRCCQTEHILSHSFFPKSQRLKMKRPCLHREA